MGSALSLLKTPSLLKTDALVGQRLYAPSVHDPSNGTKLADVASPKVELRRRRSHKNTLHSRTPGRASSRSPARKRLGFNRIKRDVVLGVEMTSVLVAKQTRSPVREPRG